MKYIYTDFGSLNVSFALTMDEIERLIELIEEIDEPKNPWFLSDIKKMLTDSRENTAALMEVQAKSIRDKDDV